MENFWERSILIISTPFILLAVLIWREHLSQLRITRAEMTLPDRAFEGRLFALDKLALSAGGECLLGSAGTEAILWDSQIQSRAIHLF